MDDSAMSADVHLTLPAWLDSLAADSRPRLIVGGTGHLDMSDAEASRTAAFLEATVVPAILGAAPAEELLLVTGLAVGADRVISETLSLALEARGRRVRRVGLLPVPPDVLWEDRPRGLRGTPADALARLRFERAIQACDSLVRLWDRDARPDWSSDEVRRAHYRRLGAALAEQCDVLVAVLRGGHAGQPGGSAEILRWRDRATPIPAEFSSGARRHQRPPAARDCTFRIDPSAPTAAPGEAALAREALRAGNYLRCYDIAERAELEGRGTADLRYLKILALANAGSTEAALQHFDWLRPDDKAIDEDWLALEGRLHKDLGLRGGPEAAAELKRAADGYLAAYRRTRGYFSGINAASMAFLAGNAARARELANDVLGQIRRESATDDRGRYYLLVSEAEALLLLGDLAGVERALRAADALLADDINARSRTLAQLRRLCAASGADPSLLTPLRLPPVVYLPAGSRRRPRLPDGPLGVAFAAIGAPGDLDSLEQLLEHGTAVHAVLPAPREALVARWQAQHGDATRARLERALERVNETSVALGFLDSEHAWSERYAASVALGLSRLAARRLGSEWVALEPERRTSGEPMQLPQITAGGFQFDRRLAAIVFADFAGFSRLSDVDLPPFWAYFMRDISRRLAAQRDDMLLKHTWGDALHLVTGSARAAAEIACQIQSGIAGLRAQLGGGLGSLELRLSAHFAPVFVGRDPIENASTCFGTSLSFAARIEPVTPPGMIFVTEAFAAQLAMEAPEAFSLEYAGEMKLAKGYGQSRLFSLRRS